MGNWDGSKPFGPPRHRSKTDSSKKTDSKSGRNHPKGSGSRSNTSGGSGSRSASSVRDANAKGSGGGSGSRAGQSAGGSTSVPSRGKGKAGPGAGDRSLRGGGAKTLPSVPAHLRRKWIQEQRCLACGDERHRVADCPVAKSVPADPEKKTPALSTGKAQEPVPSTSQGSSTSSSKSSSKGKSKKNGPRSVPRSEAGSNASLASTSSPAVKRPREPEKSGLTPPAKVTKHSYAMASAGSTKVALVTPQMETITRRCYEEIRSKLDDRWFQLLDEKLDPFTIEGWDYTPRLASVIVKDKRSYDEVKAVAASFGVTVTSVDDLEQSRRPYTKFTGLLGLPVSRRPKDDIKRLLEYEVKRLQIPGTITIHSGVSIQGSGNVLLTLRVYEDAEVKFKELDCTLTFGASGNVKFEDPRLKHVVDASTRRQKRLELEKQIEIEREKLKAKVKRLREMEKAETDSVASMGMSNLSMETEEQEKADATPAPKASEQVKTDPPQKGEKKKE